MPNRLMERVRLFLGLRASEPPSMNAEQERLAERLDRIARRQKSIDVQVEVLRADTHDVRNRTR